MKEQNTLFCATILFNLTGSLTDPAQVYCRDVVIYDNRESPNKSVMWAVIQKIEHVSNAIVNQVRTLNSSA